MTLSEEAEQALEQALDAAQAIQEPGGTVEDRALAYKAYEHFMERYRWYRDKDKQSCLDDSEADRQWLG
jgi:hypothetical protein